MTECWRLMELLALHLKSNGYCPTVLQSYVFLPSLYLQLSCNPEACVHINTVEHRFIMMTMNALHLEPCICDVLDVWWVLRRAPQDHLSSLSNLLTEPCRQLLLIWLLGPVNVIHKDHLGVHTLAELIHKASSHVMQAVKELLILQPVEMLLLQVMRAAILRELAHQAHVVEIILDPEAGVFCRPAKDCPYVLPKAASVAEDQICLVGRHAKTSPHECLVAEDTST
mmetsp:Transcript_22623/g.27306  ORF Transcript_22623/g.27306 Transcript_22623/m.27306 type:complete len:226 (-) Transcript_22623:1552-2229(-)